MITVRGPTPLQNVFILSDQFEDFWYLTRDEAVRVYQDLGRLLFPLHNNVVGFELTPPDIVDDE